MEQKIVSFEKSNFKDNEICVDDVSISYSQNADSSGLDGDELAQEITISTRNNGSGRFINIKTNSWSIDNIEDLVQIIEDFKKRAMYDDSCD